MPAAPAVIVPPAAVPFTPPVPNTPAMPETPTEVPEPPAQPLGVAILGEPLTAGLLIGFPIILGGSVLASLRTTHVAPEAS